MTVKPWHVATDPQIDEPVRERFLAAMETVHDFTDHAVEDRWQERAPEHADIDPEEAWAEAVPVHYPPAANGAVARLHAETDMILLARQGGLVSCIPLGDRDQDTRVYVRNQVRDQ